MQTDLDFAIYSVDQKRAINIGIDSIEDKVFAAKLWFNFQHKNNYTSYRVSIKIKQRKYKCLKVLC